MKTHSAKAFLRRRWLHILSLLACCSTASALTLVDVSGPVTTGGQLAGPNQAVAAVFTLTKSFTNVRVSTGSTAQPFITVTKLVISR